ncbi:MAG TPA: TIGR02996 domain-containing protein [Gemmataceae bacterium]|jgi:uncharacterized protein (TIGR02996 family)|nr:TIGR02996 domain-containing protein [Gemmataceae bacterium]
MPPDDERAFFDAIRGVPDDDGPRLIFADWLDEHGESDRADFIRIQCALEGLSEDDPRRQELRERERQLADANEARWTADLRPLVTECAFHRGVIDSVSVDAHQFLTNGPAIFERAPVRKVRFLEVGAQFRAVTHSPLLRFVRELDLSANAIGDEGPMLLARSPHLTRLDALDLGFTDLGDNGLKALADSPAFSGLRTLRLNDNPGVGVIGIRALGESEHLTALTDLDLSGNGLSDTDLQPLFEAALVERLQHLSLQGNRLRDVGTARFVNSVVFTRMAERDHVINLRNVAMGINGAAALANCPALRAVQTLDLEKNFISDPGLLALASSIYLTQLSALLLRDNQISDRGASVLTTSMMMASLRVLDLTDNMVTVDCQDRLQEASLRHNWRGQLQLLVDSQLRTRPPAIGPGGLRRTI